MLLVALELVALELSADGIMSLTWLESVHIQWSRKKLKLSKTTTENIFFPENYQTTIFEIGVNTVVLFLHSIKFKYPVPFKIHSAF